MKLIKYKYIYHGKEKHTTKRILFEDNGKFISFSGDEIENIDLNELIIGREYSILFSNFDKNKVISFKED